MILKGLLMSFWVRVSAAILFLYFSGIFVLPVIFLNTDGEVSLFFKDLHENLYCYVYGTDFYSAYSKWLCGLSANCIF